MLSELAALFTAIVAAIFALTASPPRSPVAISNAAPFSPPALSAESVFLIDTQGQAVLLERNADAPHSIASITKLMAALVFLESKPNWSSRATFQEEDTRAGDINYIIPGEEIRLAEAFKLMLIGSSNDAGALLARTIAGGEEHLVAAMNSKAKALGLRRTVFTDATGLAPENTSTAREVAALAQVALSDPQIHEAALTASFEFAPEGKAARKVRTTNQLLRFPQPVGTVVLGGKTGHIEESGYNLVFAEGASDAELIGVVLGSKSNEARFEEMKKLMAWGRQNVKYKMQN